MKLCWSIFSGPFLLPLPWYLKNVLLAFLSSDVLRHICPSVCILEKCARLRVLKLSPLNLKVYNTFAIMYKRRCLKYSESPLFPPKTCTFITPPLTPFPRMGARDIDKEEFRKYKFSYSNWRLSRAYPKARCDQNGYTIFTEVKARCGVRARREKE